MKKIFAFITAITVTSSFAFADVNVETTEGIIKRIDYMSAQPNGLHISGVDKDGSVVGIGISKDAAAKSGYTLGELQKSLLDSGANKDLDINLVIQGRSKSGEVTLFNLVTMRKK